MQHQRLADPSADARVSSLALARLLAQNIDVISQQEESAPTLQVALRFIVDGSSPDSNSPLARRKSVNLQVYT